MLRRRVRRPPEAVEASLQQDLDQRADALVQVRELAAEETHALRRAVSADGRTDLPTMHHHLDTTPGAWHLGAVDATGRVVATSSFYVVACPLRPDARPAVQLQFMAVDPAVQRMGAGSAIMAEAIRRLKADRPGAPVGQRSRERGAFLPTVRLRHRRRERVHAA
jgi:ribosomal protein S18 acetylase RimI-like enzyme